MDTGKKLWKVRVEGESRLGREVVVFNILAPGAARAGAKALQCAREPDVFGHSTPSSLHVTEVTFEGTLDEPNSRRKAVP